MKSSTITSVDNHDLRLLEQAAMVTEKLKEAVGKKIVGQHDVVDGLLTGLLANGHVLLVGVPGLAKTLLVSTLAKSLDLNFSRIQFTPDLMPTDITGTEVIEENKTTGERIFRFVKGPIFSNIILADEINRTPPKTQAALLQAMQEREVTIAGQTYPLSLPFFVLATQNPIEQEGTYPLPEAQLDRFMLQLQIGYPSNQEEEEIVIRTTGDDESTITPVLSSPELIELQQLVRRIPAAPSLVKFAVRLATSTRPTSTDTTSIANKYITWGAGPRASQYLVLGAKARAAFRGAPIPSYEDVKAVVPAILGHRLVLNFEAEVDGRTTESIIAEILEEAHKWT
tara:strand:- start:28497 stop:29516 length:1020 start_codon:yes stop_codon:yes gene_type:complete